METSAAGGNVAPSFARNATVGKVLRTLTA